MRGARDVDLTIPALLLKPVLRRITPTKPQYRREPRLTEPRPFTQVLLEHRKGGLHEELTVQLDDLVKDVVARGKGGTITLKISVKPSGSSGAGTPVVQFTDQVVVTPPKQERGASLFFSTDKGLQREDPGQPELPLRAAPPIIRDGIDLETGEVTA